MPILTPRRRLSDLAKALKVRCILVIVFALSFVLQQFMCCCGSIRAADEGAAYETCSAAWELNQHDFAHTEDAEPCHSEDPEHEHHHCIGSHIFLVPVEVQSADFAPQFCSADMIEDLCKLFLHVNRFADKIASRCDVGSSARERRALLCVYSI